MKVVRTIVWIVMLIAFVAFTVANWEPRIDVKIWQGLLIGTRLPAVVLLAFLIGLVPMWLLHRATRWNYDRRIASLENAARAAAMAPAAPPPVVEPSPVAEPAFTAEAETVAGAPRPNLSSTDETKPTP